MYSFGDGVAVADDAQRGACAAAAGGVELGRVLVGGVEHAEVGDGRAALELDRRDKMR